MGYFMVLGASAIFAFSSVLVKWGFERGLLPWQTLFLTCFVTAVPLLGLIPRLWRHTPDLRRLRFALLLHGALAVCSLAGFHLALQHLSVSLTTILFYAFPGTVVFGKWLLGQAPGRKQLVSLLLALGGVALTTGAGVTALPPGAGSVATGVGWALLAMVCMAVYMLLGERLLEGMPPTASMLSFGLIGSVAVPLLAPAEIMVLGGVDGLTLLLGVLLGLCGGLVPFWLLLRGIALIGPAPASIVATAEMPFALLYGFALLGDRVESLQGVGAVCILASILILQLAR